MKKILSLTLALAVLLSGAFTLLAGADFGDYGGDSDYGYDGGDYDFDFGNDYDYDYDDDDDDWYFGGWGSSGGSGSGGSEHHASDLESIITLLVIVAVIAIVLWRIGTKGTRKRKNSYMPPKNNTNYRQAQPRPQGRPVAPGAQPTAQNMLQPVSSYLQVDPGFNEAEFREKLSNAYVRLQNAWQAKDLTPIRPLLTDAFYAQMDRQLEGARSRHETNRVERIAVLGVTLSGWRQAQGSDIMVARLKTRIVDYWVNDTTGAVVRGNPSAEKFMDYEWELMRASGRQTAAPGAVAVHNCPNCGAVLNINHTAQCEYCGSIVTVDDYDWALNSIKGISQRTSG